MLDKGLFWRVREGTGVKIREDPWFPKPTTFRVQPKKNLTARYVCDLIDPVSRTWDIGPIIEGFSFEEATLIQCIPVSRTGCSDSLAWFHTANGIYSIKSGYGIATELMENGALGKREKGSASNKTKHSQLWRMIWSLDVPSKMKFSIWKCCNHALAVRRNLKRRRMRFDNVCGVCGTVDETENHLFFRCELSYMFWFCSPLQLNSFELEGSDFLQSWESFCNRVTDLDNAEEILQEFVFGLWKNLNGMIFNGRLQQPVEILEVWKRNIAEFKDANEQGKQVSHSRMGTTTLTGR